MIPRNPEPKEPKEVPTPGPLLPSRPAGPSGALGLPACHSMVPPPGGSVGGWWGGVGRSPTGPRWDLVNVMKHPSYRTLGTLFK